MEDQMQKAFWAQAETVLAHAKNGELVPRISNIGAELELYLYHINPTWTPASDEEKKSVIARAIEISGLPYFKQELGASMVEINPPPVDVSKAGFEGLYSFLHRHEAALQLAARENDLLIGRSGTIKGISTKKVPITPAERYRIVPKFHNDHRPFWANTKIGPVELFGAEVLGLCCAFQFTLQTENATDAIDKLNRLLFISPMAVALSPNARYLREKDTGWADVRMEAWRRTHETRTLLEFLAGKQTRIGLPRSYYRNLKDYFERVSSFPFILDNPDKALAVGIGLYWQNARIKVFGDLDNPVLGIEFRPLSTQTCLEVEIDLLKFVIGRLFYSQMTNEPLPPMSHVWKNTKQAEKYGLTGSWILPNGSVGKSRIWLRHEVELAEEGLRRSQLLMGNDAVLGYPRSSLGFIGTR